MEPKDIFEEVKPQFTKQEQDLINLLFEIEDKEPKTIEQFQEMNNLNYEQVRDILRNLLNTHKTEIAKLRPIVKKCVDSNIIIKENDILELDMRVDYPYEDGDTDCKLWFTDQNLAANDLAYCQNKFGSKFTNYVYVVHQD